MNRKGSRSVCVAKRGQNGIAMRLAGSTAVFVAVKFGFALSDNYSGPRQSSDIGSPLLTEEPSVGVGHRTSQQLDLLGPWLICNTETRQVCGWFVGGHGHPRRGPSATKSPGEARNGRRLRNNSGTSLWNDDPRKNHLFLDLCDHPPHR